jgi:hypothetical protein
LFKLTEQLIAKIAATARQQKTPVVFALAPSLVQVEDQLWTDFLDVTHGRESAFSRSAPNDRLMKFSHEYNLKMCDLLPAL